MRDYSSYQCYYYIKINNNLQQIANIACWAGLMYPKSYYYHSGKLDKYNNLKRELYNKSVDYIYIDNFRTRFNSLANTKALVNIINQITPCKLVTKNKKSYIKYKLINEGHYYSNLVLLNFIRMSWYKPDSFEYKQFFKDIRKKNVIISDPLYFLMECVKNNVISQHNNRYPSYLNHSLVTPTIIPKNVDKLFKYNEISMQKFLEQPNI